MSFPNKVREKVLVASGRHCALCHKFCGLKIELHHIIQKGEGGEDSFDNCIPLCFNCHADMRSYDHKHPKGTKYTQGELVAHRDKWYEKIKTSEVGASQLEWRAIDAANFKLFLNLVPYDDCIRLIENHMFEGAFSPAIFEKIDLIVEKYRDPSLEFINSDLEGMRADLINSLWKFADFLAHNTWRTNTNLQSIPSEWEWEQPERLSSVLETLRARANKISKIYRDLIAESRRMFGVSILDE